MLKLCPSLLKFCQIMINCFNAKYSKWFKPKLHHLISLFKTTLWLFKLNSHLTAQFQIHKSSKTLPWIVFLKFSVVLYSSCETDISVALPRNPCHATQFFLHLAFKINSTGSELNASGQFGLGTLGLAFWNNLNSGYSKSFGFSNFISETMQVQIHKSSRTSPLIFFLLHSAVLSYSRETDISVTLQIPLPHKGRIGPNLDLSFNATGRRLKASGQFGRGPLGLSAEAGHHTAAAAACSGQGHGGVGEGDGSAAGVGKAWRETNEG